MIDIFIEATITTPQVKIDSENSTILFKGKSSPANSLQFYHPLINKIPQIFAQHRETIEVNMAFRYFNTSSSKCLFDMFKMFRGMIQEGHDINVNWYYEEDDDDMLETGEDYADLLGLDFNFVTLLDIDELSTQTA